MSWIRVKLKVVLNQVKIPVSIQDSVEYKLVTVSNKGEIRLRQLVKGYEISSDKAVKCLKGHFIYSRLSVHNGAFGIVPDDLEGALLTSEMPIFSINENIYPEFLIYSLQQPSFKNQIDDLTRGVGRTRVKENSFLNIEINLPPLPIQKQIIDYLKLVGFQRNKLNYEQSHQLELIKKLRQQIFKDAMQGKLVPQNPKDEPASKLHEKIKLEKAKSGKKEKPLPKIKPEEIPFDIPENWVWCRLGEISYIASGSTPKQDAFVSEGIPYLKMYNLKNQKIDFDYRPQYIKPEVHNGQLKRSRTEIGDVIMNIVGPPLGKLAIIPETLPQANFNQAAVLIRPYSFKEMNKWIFWYLNEMSEINSIVTKGVAGQDNISVTQSNSIKIPIPPLSEQKRIVSQIEELMTLCDELEASVKANQEYTTLLYQTALKEALQPKAIEVKQKDLAIAAEPKTEYTKGKVIELPRLQEKEESHFVKRKVLATYIINQSLDDQQFGDVKFEKLLHLSDYFAIKRNLGQNYYQKVAGPLDNSFTIPFFEQIEKSKWFNRKKIGRQFQFSKAVNHSKSLNTYSYFSDEELAKVQKLIDYFKKTDYEKPEIISTLYAVWNNRIIKQQPITDALIKQDFLDWDENKAKYKDRLDGALAWMRKEGVVPDGWGKVIEKPKTKKKK